MLNRPVGRAKGLLESAPDPVLVDLATRAPRGRAGEGLRGPMSREADKASENHPDSPIVGSWRLPGLAWLLAAIAYAPLVIPESLSDPAERAEEWFFLPAEGSSGLIVLLAAWLLYRRWKRLSSLPPRAAPASVTTLAFAVGVALAVWANLTGAEDLLVPSLVANGIGLTLLFRGFRGLRLSALPLGVLLLALPLPGVLFNWVVFQFQLWTAQWAGWILLQGGVTAHVSGDLIIRPEGTFAIIEGCSGMRSVEALSLLAILLVDSFGRRGWHAGLIVALAPGVAFLMNGFRVLTLIFNPHSEIVAIHNFQGVLVLLGGLLLLVGIDSLLEKILAVRKTFPHGDKPGSAGPLIEPRRALQSQHRVAVAVLGACAAVAIAPFPGFSPPRPPTVLNTHFSDGDIGWARASIPIDIPFLGKTRFRDALHSRFQRDQDEVELFVGVGDQAERVSSFRSPKTAFPGSGWVVEADGTKWLDAIGQAVEWRLLRSGPRRVLSYRWHRGAENPFRDAMADTVALATSPFRPLGEWDGFVVRVTTRLDGPGDTGLDAAASRLDAFSASIAPTLSGLEDSLRGNGFSHNAKRRKNSSTSLSTVYQKNLIKTDT